MIVMHVFVCGLSRCFDQKLGQHTCVHPVKFVTLPLLFYLLLVANNWLGEESSRELTLFVQGTRLQSLSDFFFFFFSSLKKLH